MAYEAHSLRRLRDELDSRWPHRDRRSDGWIGDSSHTPDSDHYPDASDGGIVRARDWDSDGVHVPTVLASSFLAGVENGVTRYVIHGKRIFHARDLFAPRKYTGKNGHTGHGHDSIEHTNHAENWSGVWLLPLVPWSVTLRQSVPNQARAVRRLQALLNGHGHALRIDGVPGPLTFAAVSAFQVQHNVRASVKTVNGKRVGDRVVGQYTREALMTRRLIPWWS